MRSQCNTAIRLLADSNSPITLVAPFDGISGDRGKNERKVRRYLSDYCLSFSLSLFLFLSVFRERRAPLRLCILCRSSYRHGTATSGKKRGRRRQVNQFLRAMAGSSSPSLDVGFVQEIPMPETQCTSPYTASNGLSIVRP